MEGPRARPVAAALAPARTYVMHHAFGVIGATISQYHAFGVIGATIAFDRCHYSRFPSKFSKSGLDNSERIVETLLGWVAGWLNGTQQACIS